jgi:hypothetical protein
VLKDFHYINHVESSPCHHTSLLREARELRRQRTELVDPPPLATAINAMDYLNAGPVDYVNATPDTRRIT